MAVNHSRAIAIVGLGCILPDAPDVSAFWNNIVGKRYCISEVPPERWSVDDYYDPDPTVPDKTYSKIGGWVRGFEFDWKQYRMPPRVARAMDQGQQWAVTITAQALADYGYPDRPLDLERTGVILGTAMGGEMHYLTHLRVVYPEYAKALSSSAEFQQLPQEVREAILQSWHAAIDQRLPPITEDSMPGELANIVSGRVANLLNLRGPNFITDAACAASFAAIDAAVELLSAHHCDAVISGGVDHNMGISSFVKFCKIGALSATGSRPFGDGADGFVMGEGSAVFLLKRLADAERDGDKIYAVIRGVGASSDGKGKGITAPNPAGQVLAISRAWKNAGLDPATATLVEAHGTSTKVGDVVEVESLCKVFGGARTNNIALGSVKSNIGHLKAGAGAAGLLKAALSLHHKRLPPTLHAEKPNPNIDFKTTPFYLNHDARDWTKNGTPRRAGVSAYGFGGTNFHLVLEEHVPGMLTEERKVYTGAAVEPDKAAMRPADKLIRERDHPATVSPGHPVTKNPVRGVLAIGAGTAAELKDKLDAAVQRAQEGWSTSAVRDGGGTGWEPPHQIDLSAPERLVIDFGYHEELIDRLLKAQRALGFDNPAAWKALQAQGVFRGSGSKPGKIAFLFPGQGSQYLNMGRELAALEPIVAQTFRDGDEVMTPILGRSLQSFFFVDSGDPQVLKQGESALMQTAITQPAMLTLDTAYFKLLGEYGFKPDMAMGHSLGEYAALIAAGAMPFADALEATAARGAEMTKFSVEDNGWMAAVMAPLEIVEQTLSEIDGYVVAANVNSSNQSVIGGASKAVEQAIEVFNQKGFEARRIPVSHAFHTKIVAPAGVPLRQVLNRLRVFPPQIPIVANVTGEIYPTDPDDIRAMLQQHVASPVQWVKGLNTLYANGVRTFVEVGPKKALKGFVDDVLGNKPDVVSLFTNHPKMGELPTFNQALCGLYAAGYALGEDSVVVIKDQRSAIEDQKAGSTLPGAALQGRFAESAGQEAGSMLQSAINHQPAANVAEEAAPAQAGFASDKLIAHLVAQAVQQLMQHLQTPQPKAYDRNEAPLGSVVISGTGLGLPGAEKSVMDPDNALRILRGEQFVDLIPERFRTAMLRKRVTRLVKSADGSGHFESITDPAEVIRLAGRPGRFDLHEEYGVPEKLIEALDITTQLAMAAGLDALREAGIPLVLTHKPTTTGKSLPDRWLLPEALRDETGVIFASAFPGGDRFADELKRYYTFESRLAQLEQIEDLRRFTTDPRALDELNRRSRDLREMLGREPYTFDRRFLFRLLSMGHSQFAEYIGARGPNTQVNAACASTTLAIALAEDWIRSGRCRRVIVIGADNVASDHLLEWVGAGFLATGAAATDDRVEEAALPFDRRRHGTLIGMGACALVIESEDAVRERGMRGLVELLGSETNNSAFHGTRLDVEHIVQVMNNLLTSVERRFGLSRYAFAPQTVFMSHETFTPARGGSASAEVAALRRTFGPAADDLIVANTKGFTGHPMGVGIEDVIAVKVLEYGIVPPVPNHREIDPELGTLNFSRGGRYNVQYAIHLAAGFGSQIAMTLTRRIPGGPERIDNAAQYRRWSAEVAGYSRAETEVVKRVLRVVDQGAPIRQPAPSSWQAGTGPMVRAAVPGDGLIAAPQPLPAIAPVQAPTQPVIAPAPEPVNIEPFNQEAVIEDRKLEIEDRRLESADTVQVDRPVGEAPVADIVKGRILAIVAEKTGYPTDMLDLDLDLEADLGVDTVKQAETFAAIRGEFDIPRRDDLKLRDYPTLNHVIAFVYEMRPDLKGSPIADQGSGSTGTVASEQGNTVQAEHHVTKYTLEAADRFPRRVPTPVMRPMLELCKSTGIALDALNRVILMLDNGGTGRSLLEQLQQRGVTVLILEAPESPAALEAQIKTWLAAGPIDGVYWLPALDVEPAIEQLDLAAWRELNRMRVKNLYTTMRALYDVIDKAGTFLIAATRLGGLHGYDETGATAPLGGAVAGFAKAYKREHGAVLVKVVDFAPDATDVAEALIAETLRDPGIVEVGYHRERRFSIGLTERSAVDGRPGLTLDKNTVFVVTGAAGGITSEVVTDLSAASGGVFYLLDLASAPEWNSANITLFRSNKEALKQKLIDELKAAGEKPTPVKVEKQLFAVERSEAALRAVEAVEAAGGVASYHSVNLLDSQALGQIIADVRERYGRLDVLLHAGGVEISRALQDKEAQEFDLVFDVKTEGFFNILHAARDLPIGVIVSFSSVAGRFGNAGQTDYSAANDLLCKITSNLRRTWPGTRAIVVDWTAWGGIGMATRGSIPKIMEAAGIDLLPPDVGVPTIRRELACGGTRGEVVVAGRLGLLLNEFDETGGLDAAKVNRLLARSDPPLAMIGVVKGAKLHAGLEIETTLDPNAQPFLFDHQMEGVPLLPGVMGVEAFAQVASLVAPGHTIAAVERVQFASPFKFYRRQPRPLHLGAVVMSAPEGDELIAHTTLRSITPAPKSDLPPQEKVHFTAQVRLTPNPIEPRATKFTSPAGADFTFGREDIYRIFFHGPAYQVIERVCVEGNRAIGLISSDLPPNASPANAAAIMAPRLIEACFQTAGIWKIAVQQQLALPLSIRSVTTYRQMEDAQGRLYAIVMTTDGEAFDAQVIDEAGNVYIDLKEYRTIALPGAVNF
jgi:acyl transferase domain-containing protein/NAD(P)-dependent dehydrogenase (short-subunit alcohol dehydrogenase family)